MSRLGNLLREVEQHDPQLAEDLLDEVRELRSRRSFGLNFERHTPETVELPGREVRKGDKVRLLPTRGESNPVDRRLWRVTRVETIDGKRTASLTRIQKSEETSPERLTLPTSDLIVVAEFRDAIYPGLKSTGTVERGANKPFHAVINAENYHALQALVYTHEARADVVYLDPPYNTGARDWKYNNDYVDSDDAYRHSKWLAFMERRLKVARKLLNPVDSVLIVSIDEKEYLRLGLLLEQTFPEAKIQMVSVAINPAPPSRNGLFGRADEYYFFVLFGEAGVQAAALGEGWATAKGRTHRGEIRWDLLRKSGASPTREGHPDTFYPFFIATDGPRFHSVGEAIGVGADRESVRAPEGTIAAWPIRKDGSEGRWRLQPSTARAVLDEGGLRIGALNGERTPIYYLAEGERKKIVDGIYEVSGHRDDGSVVTTALETVERRIVPGTQWRIPAHDSTQYGSRLLANLLPGRKFPYPKSLYAVEDALRFFMARKPSGTVIDFFAGSGTTAHAVMRLNRQDGGQRTSISVTNNEVSAEEQAGLRSQGLRPGDDAWEQLGICEYITKPRIKAAVTGIDSSGQPIAGDYRFADEFPIADGFSENFEFFTLTYEAPRAVAHNRSFDSVAGLLWMKAGGRGSRIESVSSTYAFADIYGVLFDLDCAHDFTRDVAGRESVATAFVVTDDERAFQTVCAELPGRVVAHRLYESYLTNFTISVNGE